MMHEGSDIRPIRPEELASALEILCQAFDCDPWMNFLAKHDDHRRDRLRVWLRRGLERRTFPFGETYQTHAGEGIALWVPPDHGSDAWWGELELRWTLARVAGLGRISETRDAIRRIVSAEPRERHMELRLLAVRPERQGQGIAAALIRPMLRRCDEADIPVALLCTAESTVPLYEHFGFRVTSEVSIPGGPVLWQMMRAVGASNG